MDEVAAMTFREDGLPWEPDFDAGLPAVRHFGADHAAHHRFTRCPCGCEGSDADGELDTPDKVRAALVRMTEFRVMEGP